MDEFTAVELLKHGELDGLEWLVNQYHRRAFQIAFLITQDGDLADDVVQEAFISLLHTMRRFDESRPFSPWFFKCVSNAAVQAAQKTSRQVSLDYLPGEGDLFARLTDGLPAVEDEVESAELKEKLAQLMLQLDPRQRAVLVQRYYLDMSEAEMAEEHEIPRGTVKWLLSEARRKLRFLLKQER